MPVTKSENTLDSSLGYPCCLSTWCISPSGYGGSAPAGHKHPSRWYQHPMKLVLMLKGGHTTELCWVQCEFPTLWPSAPNFPSHTSWLAFMVYFWVKGKEAKAVSWPDKWTPSLPKMVPFMSYPLRIHILLSPKVSHTFFFACLTLWFLQVPELDNKLTHTSLSRWGQSSITPWCAINVKCPSIGSCVWTLGSQPVALF